MKGDLHTPTYKTRRFNSQRRIGITGGIASGKTSVGKFLNEIKHLPIIDADIIARKALEPGEKATQKVLARYGNQIECKNQKNSIDRDVLSKIIFSDISERKWLEKLIHPIVIENINKELEKYEKMPILILIIPLLFEANLTSLCSEIWLINCDLQQQLQRLIARDCISEEEAQRKINSQLTLSYKKKLADVIIDNSGYKNSWIKQVEKYL